MRLAPACSARLPPPPAVLLAVIVTGRGESLANRPPICTLPAVMLRPAPLAVLLRPAPLAVLPCRLIWPGLPWLNVPPAVAVRLATCNTTSLPAVATLRLLAAFSCKKAAGASRLSGVVGDRPLRLREPALEP